MSKLTTVMQDRDYKRIASRIQNRLLRAFIWAADIDRYGKWEDWRSHYSELVGKKGYIIRGDCDDFACTAAE